MCDMDFKSVLKQTSGKIFQYIQSFTAASYGPSA